MRNTRTDRPRAACGILIAVGLAFVSGAFGAGSDAVPVRVGGSVEQDACSSVAVPTGLKPDGDGYLAVRAGPGTRYRMLGELVRGQRFYVCPSSGDAAWSAIVYSDAGQDLADCGVSGPIASARVYAGPCGSGWVSARWVEVVAG